MRLIILLIALLPLSVSAQDTAEITEQVVQDHILPGFQALSSDAAALRDAAATDCTATAPETAPDLRAAYSDAFDRWVAVSHLRFGPTETQDRAFALAFWPDSRGATPKALGALIAGEDPIAASPEAYREVSIAARGFYALEFLLYDETLLTAEAPAYRCQLIQTVTRDIADVTRAVLTDWETGYAAQMIAPAPDGRYRSHEEAAQELFKALSTGLQFTADTRLGRPLGTFDRPRPTRAEAWRSGRSLRHVTLSLEALRDLAQGLAQADPQVQARLEDAFARSLALATDLDDPVFAGVRDPQQRLKVEVLQQSIDKIRLLVRDELGPLLGVAAGFNALDGD